ncbi:hypothetical protein BRD00_11040 [Halobacteriales archaeon QS_8_69_26]|nr:MAG: hypothetical protein BRD00_11040 [Halobacteriales archaeon QS_8_69_26]
MGLLDSLFDGGTGDDDGSKRYAVLMNAGPEDFAKAGNGFQYAIELDEAGYDVELFLDGKATQWPAEFAEDPDRPFGHHWSRLQSRGILTGACGYCANAFDADEACRLEDVELLSGADEHAPAVARLADEGYELLTVG